MVEKIVQLDSARLNQRLFEILREKFGFAAFRPYQEEVCRAAATGQDLLLVMPTGAGKSLCYQLPGLARRDTTLVISPLLALIEDQVAKLRALGLNAERIHSGRDRETSRGVCAEYLKGNLDFLFIAPERLAVPGFVEMLARRKPALIAVDEAHCISQWGHDFRPEYRMLGARLPALRPAPILALTATATPRVQDDIVAQLGIPTAERYIHGFRRTNIAIEVVELNPGERIDALRRALGEPASLPAIVYAPTRKRAEEAAGELEGEFKIAAYHAGLSSGQRERIQAAFLSGSLDVIVATIAFGMGIDKANVRTVVHLALPSSVEGYYQEIGRAGRDGLPSKAVLMHAFVDRRTHEFFFERDYPELSALEKIFKATPAAGGAIDTESLREKSGVSADLFEKALEKLWIHGGVRIDADQLVTRAEGKWDVAYLASRRHREGQLDLIQQYTRASGCRMAHLVKYFGDTSDDGHACELCDVCAPERAGVGRFHAMSSEDTIAASRILEALATDESPSTGKLHRDLFNERELDRRGFERLLGGLARARLVSIYEDSFSKDGREIAFRRASLTTDGAHLVREGLAGLAELVELPAAPTLKSSSSRKKKPAPAPRARSSGAGSGSGSGFDEIIQVREPSPEVLAALKAWRLGEARSKRLPAFRILSDRVLIGIAQTLPKTEASLIEVHGMGPKLAEKYGSQILKVLESAAHGG
ncbi:MAG: ATP-dependent DNA helicase RecQ [Deltaproteobacteria bacterium]|nr:ATP-dependent DNA helicase RecQ [Deltaproteobacteria bacterium]